MTKRMTRYGLGFLALTIAMPLFASANGTRNPVEIWGYAIQCWSYDYKIRVSARQWDDDFAFQSRGLGKGAAFIFMTSPDQNNLNARSLAFAPAEGKDQLSFVVDKIDDDIVEGGSAGATVTFNDKATDLQCRVKYAKSDDEFATAGLGTWADSVLNTPTSWGGKGVGLVQLGSSATFAFDCASGSVEDNWVAKNGVFEADGTFKAGSGMVLPPNLQTKPGPANYRAVVKGNDMELTLTRGKSPIAPITFKLTKGAKPDLRRCM